MTTKTREWRFSRQSYVDKVPIYDTIAHTYLNAVLFTASHLRRSTWGSRGHTNVRIFSRHYHRVHCPTFSNGNEFYAHQPVNLCGNDVMIICNSYQHFKHNSYLAFDSFARYCVKHLFGTKDDVSETLFCQQCAASIDVVF